jgi:ligand-binding sensor domain-containing protein
VSPRLAALDFTAYVYSLAIDPRNPATVYVGTYNGLFKSNNAGRTWRGSGNGLSAKFEEEVQALAVNPRATSIVYAGLWGAGVFKSTDSGNNWQSVLRGVVVYALAIDPRTGTVYAATGQGVFRSANGDRRTWENVGAVGRGRVTTLAIDPRRAGTVYAGTWSGVFKSVNRGRGWRAVNQGLGSRSVRALVIDPRSASTIYAGVEEGGVFRSTDGGASWQSFNDGLTSLSVAAVGVASNGSALYAGTWGGVFSTRSPSR